MPSHLSQIYADFLAAKTRRDGETDDAYALRFAAAAKALDEAAKSAGFAVQEVRPFHLDSVDVPDLVGDPDVNITAPGITLVEIADDSRLANETIDAAIAKVRNNIKVGMMAAASIAGTLAGGGAPVAVLPIIAGAIGKIQ